MNVFDNCPKKRQRTFQEKGNKSSVLITSQLFGNFLCQFLLRSALLLPTVSALGVSSPPMRICLRQCTSRTMHVPQKIWYSVVPCQEVPWIALRVNRSALFKHNRHALVRHPIEMAAATSHFSRATNRVTSTRLFSSHGGEQAENVNDNGETVHSNSDPSSVMANALLTAIQQLEANQVVDAEESAIQLLAHALQLDWTTGHRAIRNFYHHALTTTNTRTPKPATVTFWKEISSDLDQTDWQTRFEKLVQRRLTNEPLQYILGQWDFLDYTLEIQAPLLCPRPETEELVLLAEQSIIEQISSSTWNTNAPSSTLRLLDVGCGTGCLGIAVADRLANSLFASKAVTSIHVDAIDIEPVAVETSNRNAQHILTAHPRKLPVTYTAQLVSAQEYRSHAGGGDESGYHAVVSNPPYIPQADMEELDASVKDFESHVALCGGDDGMDVIKVIVQRLPDWCDSNDRLSGNASTREGICWMEVDPSHPEKIQNWLSSRTSVAGVRYVSSHKDMFGLERFVRLQVSGKPPSGKPSSNMI